MTLTVKQVAKLTTPGRYGDGRGLYLQVTPAGVRSWLLRYERGGVERAMGLGPVGDFTLIEARERARKARQLLRDGIDPIEARLAKRDAERNEQAARITFKQAAEKFIALHDTGWRNAKHRQQWRNTLASYAYPILGSRPVKAIDAALINQALAPIWLKIPDSAVRVKGRIERVCQWVKDGMPLPAAAASKREHQPALPYERLPEFMADLRGRGGVSARALEFAILTATRTGAIIGATRDEINPDCTVWTIPGRREGTKIKDPNGDHAVPLTDRAAALLKALPREKGNNHLFIGGRRGKPLSDAAMATVIDRMNAERQKEGLPKYVDPKQKNREIVPHGFRSSFRDWAGDCTAFPREVAEAALAHAIKDKTEAAYRRATALDKRRKLMEAWAAYCTTPQRDATITPIHARAGR